MLKQTIKNKVGAEEWALRVQLAAAYRLVYHFGWDDLVYTHISARIPNTDHHFLLNPLGLTFDEICASNLVKVDLNGNVLDDSNVAVNKAGFVIHSAIHEARQDAMCVIHLHSDYGVAVSMQNNGLIPASQTAMMISFDIAYHDYEGVVTRDDEKKRLIDNIKNKNTVILRNHGTITIGETVGKAFERTYYLEKACKYQILAQSGGRPFYKPSADVLGNVMQGALEVNKDMPYDHSSWEALLRRLDRVDPSFKN
ncbi:MAG: class II aldolase/adducin family protein [Pseudomonadota bacterium]